VAEKGSDKKRSFKLEIVNPERMIVDEEVESVSLPAVEGSLGIMRNHVPILGGLDIGVIKYRKEGQPYYVACNLGVFEMQKNVLRILADTAELSDQIDLARAKESMMRAEKRLAEREQMNTDVLRAELALRRAIARIKAEQSGEK
jgi:F-type H+-transporting ATPase subunit epsilon